MMAVVFIAEPFWLAMTAECKIREVFPIVAIQDWL